MVDGRSFCQPHRQPQVFGSTRQEGDALGFDLGPLSNFERCDPCPLIQCWVILTTHFCDGIKFRGKRQILSARRSVREGSQNCFDVHEEVDSAEQAVGEFSVLVGLPKIFGSPAGSLERGSDWLAAPSYIASYAQGRYWAVKNHRRTKNHVEVVEGAALAGSDQRDGLGFNAMALAKRPSRAVY